MILKDIILTIRSITKLVKMMNFIFIFIMLKMGRYFGKIMESILFGLYHIIIF